MRCFYHQDQDAVGSCKSCGKGLCPECAVDLGKGLACRNRCEIDARALIALVDHNLYMRGMTGGLLRSSRTVQLGATVLYCAMGFVFLLWGLLTDPKLNLLSVLGGLFLAYGLFSMARVWRTPRVNTAPSEAPE